MAACTAFESDPRGPGTRQMAVRLDQIATAFEAKAYPYSASQRLAILEETPEPADLPGRLLYNASVGEQLFNAGRFREAVARLQFVADELARNPGAPPDFTRTVRGLLAAGHYQISQHDHCVQPSGTEACLIPTPATGTHGGAHTLEAIRVWGTILSDEPADLGVRWLLNLAYMNRGEHPDSVPRQWLIAADAFRSDTEFTRFVDVAPGARVNVLGLAGGSIVDDFDGDGYLDIIASSWGVRDQLRYFRNDTRGAFTDMTALSGLAGIVGGLNLIQADYNNDGHLDVLVLRGGWMPEGHPNSLLQNNGDGTFEDVTEEAGMLEPWYPTQTAAWGDYDNDGWVDLFVGNETQDRNRNPSQLFRNNRDGTFSDVARETGAAVIGFVKGVVWGDVDNDGRLDLFLSRNGQRNRLLHNDGPDDNGRWTFTDVSTAAGVEDPIDSFPTWFWDYDNDGWLDLFVSGYRTTFGDLANEYLGLPHASEVPRLYRNDRDGTFTDVTQAVRLDRISIAMGANFGDLDNDGHLDFYLGTGDMDFRALVPNRMFRNDGSVFQDVTTAGGFGHLQKGHGISFGDLDLDGDQDIYAVMGGAYEGDVAYNVLFQNPGHGNAWVTLKLEGVASNRSAIGARISVSVQTAAGPRDIHRVVSSGGSFGANSLIQEIGLGQATSITTIRVTWPVTGNTDVYRDLEMNRIYRIREGDPTAERLELRSVRFAVEGL